MALGHAFRTRSDTEVIVHAYEAWGERAFERFNGQWAIALWDSRARAAGARARSARRASALLRASTTARVDVRQRGEGALRRRPVDAARARPARASSRRSRSGRSCRRSTVFAGHRRARPGHSRVYDATAGCATPRTGSRRTPSRTAVSRARSTTRSRRCARRLEQATRLRMLRADVPVGSYLSRRARQLAGRVARAARRRARGSDLLAALRGRGVRRDRVPAADGASGSAATHHEVVVSRDDIARVVPRGDRLHRAADAAHGAGAAVPAVGLVREHGIKVVLTGQRTDGDHEVPGSDHEGAAFTDAIDFVRRQGCTRCEVGSDGVLTK